MPDLNIKNAETYRLVKALADHTGESMTEAVTVAVRERLERIAPTRSEEEIEAEVQRILTIAADFGSRFPPGYLEKAFDDLYDEDGLPK
jgi:antitoxin VapB